ncbi:MAG: hypothetical protein HC830_11760 [Bacteroidetes bacterium]|nr:hypothetical protein [Bacteroidota bacterium]
MQATLSIKYQLYDVTDNTQGPVLTDSATHFKSVEKRNVKRVLIVPLFIRANPGRLYTMKIVTLDVNRKASHTASLYVDKLSNSSVQNYKLIHSQGGAPIFRQYIHKDDFFKIVNNRNRIEKLYIRYQKTRFLFLLLLFP